MMPEKKLNIGGRSRKKRWLGVPRREKRNRCARGVALPGEWQRGVKLQLLMMNHFPD